MQAIFSALQRLLRKATKRALQVTIQWRPLYDCLQATHLGPTSSSVHASSAVNAEHLRALRDLIFAASSFWAPGALGEIVRVLEPALHALHSRAPFPALAMLYMFLPNNGACAALLVARARAQAPSTRRCNVSRGIHKTRRPLYLLLPPSLTVALSELRPGTAAGWIRVWASVDHCSDFDALWGGVFCCLSGANSFEESDVDGSAADGGATGDKLAWGTHIPLFMTRLTASLELPVLGGSPPRNKLPSICEIVSFLCGCPRKRCPQRYPRRCSHGCTRIITRARAPPTLQLLGSRKPRAVTTLSGLAISLLTARIPASVTDSFAEPPAPTSAAVTAVSESAPLGTSATGSLVARGSGKGRAGAFDASVLGFLERLLRASTPLFHPAQNHFHSLLFFVRSLALPLVRRVGREGGAAAAHALLARAGVPSPTSPPSSAARAGVFEGGKAPPVTVDILLRFVDATLPLVSLGLCVFPRRAHAPLTACRIWN